MKKNSVMLQSSIIFLANTDIDQYLYQQTSLGMIVDSMQSLPLAMNPDKMFTVKRKTQYNVKILKDASWC
ncbi:hypothetical protein DPMN_145360 [Dreissena polymorpha]|uniref:Uncharacterized protein n=1 Tax=Dreissena polymorpha TaxID=45954 RepID=A0A9D4J0Z0_DREPO|nr:hypothetical protein DPMN_145360 [Dreissena polymorpha]